MEFSMAQIMLRNNVLPYTNIEFLLVRREKRAHLLPKQLHARIDTGLLAKSDGKEYARKQLAAERSRCPPQPLLLRCVLLKQNTYRSNF